MIDKLGRNITYLRLSITDRCNLRCRYGVPEEGVCKKNHADMLTEDEMITAVEAAAALGITKLRITGGEPLIKRNILSLCRRASAIEGIRDVALTTNGILLPQMAQDLKDAGVNRLNISLDTLDAERFRAMTRVGDLQQVLAGIDAAQQAGFASVKINSVIIRGRNDDEIQRLTEFAIQRGLDITFIEEMPLGHVGRSREQALFRSDQIQSLLEQRYRLAPSVETTGGPARYVRLEEHPQTRVGFISPHSNNFCSSCNRVRLTSEGRLLLCLGNEHDLDMRALLRRHPLDDQPLIDAVRNALQYKPERHEFSADGEVQILRFMNASGG